MKKSILFLAMIIGVAFGVSAQCNIDSTDFATGKYVYPDSLPCIYQGTAYSGTVNIKIPDSLDVHDFYSAIPAGNYYLHLDSVRIDSVTGMPTGITSAINPAFGSWIHGGEYGCSLFSGTTTDTAGSYPVSIYGRGCVHGTVLIYTIDSCVSGNLGSYLHYNLNVCYPAGINNVSGDVSLNIYPNPNQGVFTVNVSSANRLVGTMSVSDQLGRIIKTQNIDVTGTKQLPIELGNLSSGVYLLEINAEGSKSVKQFIVK